MAEPTLYERLGGIFAIAAVVDNFSDRLLKNPTIVQANSELHQWHTVTYPRRLPGLKWLRTLWLASLAGGPFQYTGRELRDAHFDLKIPPEVFDEVAAELARTLDEFNVPEREKAEVLAGFAGEKGEVTAGSQPGAVNWRRWRLAARDPGIEHSPGTAGRDAAEAVTLGGRCQTIKRCGQAGQSGTTGRRAAWPNGAVPVRRITPRDSPSFMAQPALLLTCATTVTRPTSAPTGPGGGSRRQQAPCRRADRAPAGPGRISAAGRAGRRGARWFSTT
jgi:hemoglobin